MTITELGIITASNGLALTDGQLGKLSDYAGLLRAKNQVVNLISRKDEENILSKHLLHSLTLVLPKVTLAGIGQGSRVFDLGTGGGLPGIPLKIARPDLSLLLCDSILKKITAVSEMVRDLGLSTISAITDRAENLATRSEHKQRYDYVVTRAVAPLDELAQWSRGLLKPKGILLCLKGGDLRSEMEQAQRLKFITSVEEANLTLEGFDEFLQEEKKIVRVTMV
ncbi:MAG: 16S rRNA (guanine(527)-N(7))-methyltransferase RsmG [Bacteroidota bacterium]|nr:16S rRNA (guanine(527)-N(7))-methyltransferase RsmG [Bacteroidota bacterium]MDP4229923.1 16S rRNA (guanine(527)-N(7))-methyltransferase RsmG [Bacteroidota bacterium]MDP4237370.1 16S rRNA (guanine(527)-N(7))-methyltransferase RsmG [Bacteroidota bacterium]